MDENKNIQIQLSGFKFGKIHHTKKKNTTWFEIIVRKITISKPNQTPTSE